MDPTSIAEGVAVTTGAVFGFGIRRSVGVPVPVQPKHAWQLHAMRLMLLVPWPLFVAGDLSGVFGPAVFAGAAMFGWIGAFAESGRRCSRRACLIPHSPRHRRLDPGGRRVMRRGRAGFRCTSDEPQPHYELLVGIIDVTFLLGDPSWGMRELSPDSFGRSWSGRVFVVLSPAERAGVARANTRAQIDTRRDRRARLLAALLP